jgi:hypothetical protein
MSRTRNALVFVALALVAATPALAGFQETITKGEGFPADPRELGRIAIFVTECDPALDCSRLVAFAIQETADSDVGITVVPETSVRQALFSAGKTAYEPEMREALMEELELGGVLEIHVPHAERSDGFGGRTKSQVKVEMVLLGPDGSVLMHAVGTGRPLNVMSSPERVAGTVIENILREAWK